MQAQEQQPAEVLSDAPLDINPPPYPSIPLTNPSSFASIIALSKLSVTTFVNTAPVIAGGARILGGQGEGEGQQRKLQMVAYGGQVFAQAAWAAAQTVGRDWIVHNITANFLAPGIASLPFTYRVRAVMDGSSHSLRVVEATQPSTVSELGITTATVTCRATVSFKKRGSPANKASPFDYQTPPSPSVKQTLGRLHAGASPHPNALVPTRFQSLQALLASRYMASEPLYTPSIAGVEAVLLPLCGPALDDSSERWEEREEVPSPFRTHFPFSRHNPRRMTTTIYTVVGGASEFIEVEANVAICAHLNAVDGITLWDAAALLGLPLRRVRAMCTLGMSVVVHDAGGLKIADGDRKRWFVQEGWVDRYADERVVFCTRVWDERGVCVLSSWQEGVLKVTRGARL